MGSFNRPNKELERLLFLLGDAMPFGSYYGLDLESWLGNESANEHSALFNKQLYKDPESIAKDLLIRDFHLTAQDLSGPKIFFH